MRFILWLYNVGVTLAAWAYFTLGFVLFHAPFYLVALTRPDSAARFQRYNRRFLQRFFALIAALCPAVSWEIDPGIRDIRGAVVLCNHQSYLDSLLLISLLPRSVTVVKPTFFKVPIFAALLRKTGYFPATGRGPYGGLLLAALESLPEFFVAGGSLFLFPEGTRNRQSDDLLALQTGALKLALRAQDMQRPLAVLRVDGSKTLFPPGKFLFNAGTKNRVRLRLLATIAPGECRNADQLRERLEKIHASARPASIH
ncbi:MAG: 1-acyl-sn-glycerol-3-phosphate acyltransferase [Desulfobulbaceae bacterium]|nr:1-acyl-sn-glycerol-3-phosphate acyltransferase [Desulfobulbaceae bacterium]